MSIMTAGKIDPRTGKITEEGSRVKNLREKMKEAEHGWNSYHSTSKSSNIIKLKTGESFNSSLTKTTNTSTTTKLKRNGGYAKSKKKQKDSPISLHVNTNDEFIKKKDLLMHLSLSNTGTE